MTLPSPRPTMDDVARAAGVSKKTISRFINNSPDVSTTMRARVEATIAALGFVPNAQARALALRRTFLVALVHDGSDPGMREAVESGMLRAMEGSELALVLRPLEHDEAAGLRAFVDRHIPTGVVLLPPLSEREDLAAICEASGVRCARLGRVHGEHGLACDDRGAMAALVGWLVRQGHNRIGLVGGPEASLTARQRELGYLDAMADHGFDRGLSLIVTGDYSFASGAEAARLLLELSPRPSAIVACNDEMAAGVIAAAAAAGIAVPGTLSVVGFGNTAIAAMTAPPLTSIHFPWSEMGREAAARVSGGLIEPLADPWFETEIVLRESVQARPHHIGVSARIPESVPAARR